MDTAACSYAALLPDPVLAAALAAADRAGHRVRGTTSPNPPVGAVILDRDNEVVGVGATHPAGGPHAEVVALSAAGERARGGTAVVTLEPCNHTGRTGPCSQALLDAGITRVIYAFADPGKAEGGGGAMLRERGVAVTGPLISDATVLEGVSPFSVEPWLTAVRLGRPHVTVKYAGTADGFAAATDGTSQWITGPTARARVHLDRSRRDAIVVGTGTAVADNPRLTARRPDGSLYSSQPLRVVIGQTAAALSADAAIRPALTVPTRDLDELLAQLWRREIRDVILEGGPRVTASFVAAGLVDAFECYTAPALLGAGIPVVSASPDASSTMADIHRFELRTVETLGSDVLMIATRPQ